MKGSTQLGPAASIALFAAVGLALVAVVLVLTNGDDDEPASADSGAVPADVAGWAYTLSNRPGENANSVVAVAHDKGGSMAPLRVTEYPTKGAGGRFDPSASLGRFAGDTQVTVSKDGKFLFAVNQGSDTVAVFRIDKATGGLTHVEGSPFPSGGYAPVATGFNGKHLVVVNHGVRPGEELPGNPPQTNLTSFSVSPAGALKRVNSVPTPSGGPTAAAFSPNGRVVFDAGFFDGNLRSFTIDGGRLTPAPGSPYRFPREVYADAEIPPFLPPETGQVPYGMVAHPTQPVVYYLAAGANKTTAYRYDEQTGRLSFIKVFPNAGRAPCWAIITNDGRFLYTGNSATRDISVYAVSANGENLRQIQTEKSQVEGAVANLAFDPEQKVVYSLSTAESADAPRGPEAAKANFVEAFTIGTDGRLSPIGLAALPVGADILPYGLATVGRGD